MLAEELRVKPGVLMNPGRVALTGQAVSPGLFDVMVLGREKDDLSPSADIILAYDMVQARKEADRGPEERPS